MKFSGLFQIRELKPLFLGAEILFPTSAEESVWLPLNLVFDMRLLIGVTYLGCLATRGAQFRTFILIPNTKTAVAKVVCDRTFEIIALNWRQTFHSK